MSVLWLLSKVERDGIQTGIDWFIARKGSELKVLQAVPQVAFFDGDTAERRRQHRRPERSDAGDLTWAARGSERRRSRALGTSRPYGRP